MSQFELVVMGFGAHFIDLHLDGIIAEVSSNIEPLTLKLSPIPRLPFSNRKLPKCVWVCVEPIWLVLGSLDTHVHMAFVW